MGEAVLAADSAVAWSIAHLYRRYPLTVPAGPPGRQTSPAPQPHRPGPPGRLKKRRTAVRAQRDAQLASAAGGVRADAGLQGPASPASAPLS